MKPLVVSQHMPQRSLHPKKSSHTKTASAAAAYKPIRPTPDVSRSSSFDATEIMKKPMRPLTAYHIFFQIEREFIIQTAAPGHVDSDANKSFLRDVPRRYRSIRLLPDWYAGPGKRQKRKHRKSHGMIGFLELSRVISKRWATLDTSDPETKRFVTRIATRELEKYKLEMKEYKETSADATSSPAMSIAVPFSSTPSVKKQPSPVVRACATMISPSASPRHHHDDYFSFCDSCDGINDEIDYSICTVSNNGHYIPSLSPIDSATVIHPGDLSIWDPLFELEDNQYVFARSSISSDLVQSLITSMKRCVSPVSSPSSSDMDIMDVDNINVDDDDFLQLLS